jgi:hypothetical protein
MAYWAKTLPHPDESGLLDVFTKTVCLNISINSIKYRFVY